MTCLAESPIEERFRTAGFDVKSIEGFGPGRFGRLSNIAKQFSPDVIFTYGGPETTAAFFFKGKARLIRFYGYKIDVGNPLQATTRKLGNMRVDQVMAPSNAVAAGVLDQVHCPVGVVPLGIDTSIFGFKDLPRSERPELLIFGRLDPVKGHREFMGLFKKMLALAELHSTPRPKLKIVGLPANLSKTHLLEDAKRVGLSSDDFDIQCDRISNVSDLMSKVALGVISSIGSEAICRVAEEFLLCGTPVVTTSVGSLPEVFTRPEFGANFGDYQSDNAAQIVFDRLMSSHAESSTLRQERAILAKGEFSLEAMSQRLKPLVFAGL